MRHTGMQQMQKQLPGARVSFRSRSSQETVLGAVSAGCPMPLRCKGEGNSEFELSKSHRSR